MSTELTVAKVEARASKHKADVELMRELLRNPVVEALAGTMVVVSLRKAGFFQGVTGALEEGVLETAILSIILAQQIAPSIPYLVQGTTEMGKVISSIAPMLAAAGAAGG
jgi:hypothetical protein